MKVMELMTDQLYTCSPEDTLDVPARQMWDHDVGVVPVVNQHHRVVGMVTDRDIAMGSLLSGRPLQAIPVHESMSKRVVTCKPSDTIAKAAKLMREHQLHRLAVVDSFRELVGVLSLADLARASADGRVNAKDLAEILESISHPRHPEGTKDFSVAA